MFNIHTEWSFLFNEIISKASAAVSVCRSKRILWHSLQKTGKFCFKANSWYFCFCYSSRGGPPAMFEPCAPDRQLTGGPGRGGRYPTPLGVAGRFCGDVRLLIVFTVWYWSLLVLFCRFSRRGIVCIILVRTSGRSDWVACLWVRFARMDNDPRLCLVFRRAPCVCRSLRARGRRGPLHWLRFWYLLF